MLMIDLQDPTVFDDDITQESRLAGYLNVVNRAEGARQRIEREFPTWFSESLENLQLVTGVPKNQRIETKINFHLKMVVSDVDDTRTLEELIHLADPEKFKNLRGPIPSWCPNSKALNGVFNFIRSKIQPPKV